MASVYALPPQQPVEILDGGETVEVEGARNGRRALARVGRRRNAMALSRRVSRVERGLDVQGRIRHGLTEARAFPSVETYPR